ncbi:MAG: sugar nucleotide-binding protein [bacterium]|nr:sugar nucleotide-binding protein [bacterium]
MAERPIVIVGGRGMLGRALCAELERRGRPWVAPGRDVLDLTDAAVGESLARLAPAAVVNAAAFSDVGAAELEENRRTAYEVNGAGPGRLAVACAELAVPLVHVSTDFVFDGEARTPYAEDAEVGPLQVYGASKLAGERAVLESYPAACVARTSTLYGPGPRARPHYVDAILRQARSNAEVLVVRLPESSPTHTPDLGLALLALLEARAVGIVHTTNRGGCTRLELARAAVRLAGLAGSTRVEERPRPEGELDRPEYSVLSTERLTEITGHVPREWDAALADYVTQGAK